MSHRGSFQLGDWLVEPTRNRISKAGLEGFLEPLMMDTLTFLVSEAPETVPVEKLLDELWQGQVVEASKVHRTVNKLRSALSDTREKATYIETVPKRGYRIAALIKKVSDVKETAGETPKSGARGNVDLKLMKSIAVLPFVNMSNSEEVGFLAQGLSEDILDSLAQFDAINVASRSASFQFEKHSLDHSNVGEHLNVGYILEGSVRQQDDIVRITAQLIRTENGFHIWSKSYERTLADGFEVQTAVATNIAFIVQSELTFDVYKNYGWRQQREFDGIDPIAVQQFVNAANEFRNILLGEGGDMEAQVQFLKNATEADRGFYHAYNLLAHSYFWLHQRGRLPLKAAKPAADRAISSAIALAPDNFSIQFQLAKIHLVFDLDYACAESEFNQILKQDPKMAFGHFHIAIIALQEGRTLDALRLMANASQFNAAGEEALFLVAVATVRCIGGDYQGAISASSEALTLALGRMERGLALWLHAFNLILLGHAEEAKPFIEEGWEIDANLMPERYIVLYANIGELEKARNILSNSHSGLTNHFFLAMGYLAIDDIDNTLHAIQNGIENHDHFLLHSLVVAQWWDPIRDDPRFEEMLDLLDSKVTHTAQYLSDRNVELKRQ